MTITLPSLPHVTPFHITYTAMWILCVLSLLATLYCVKKAENECEESWFWFAIVTGIYGVIMLIGMTIYTCVKWL